LTAFEKFRCDAKFIKHLHRTLLICFFLLSNCCLKGLKIFLRVTSEFLASDFLSLSLGIARLELGEISSVLENLNEAILGQSLVGCLLNSAYLFNCLLKELLLCNVFKVNIFNERLRILRRSLFFFNLSVQDSDGLTKLGKINLNCLA
jgi:hypothetical protein